MTIPYIPPDDAGKLLWLTNFNTWMQANGGTHGFSAGELTSLGTETIGFSGAMVNNTNALAAARAATAAKNTSRGTAFALARAYAQRLQNDPNTTDADRAAAGLTVPDTTPTAATATDIMTIPPPLLLLDFSVRRQVTVHWGPNPSDERNNGRPAGTLGCQVQAARGGISLNEASWIALEIDTESPIIHVVNESVPITYAYRARYVGRNLKFGPLGDPVVCTVSV